MPGPGGATQAEREAARWIARLEASDVSLEDHRRFRQWLREGLHNRAAYEALAQTWDRLDLLKNLDVNPSPPRPSRRWLLAGAAAGTLAIGATAVMLVLPNAEAIAYATGVGERRTVRLKDGSTTELDAASRMDVRFEAHLRRVRLDAGEALFDVRHDQDRPFVVETAFGDVRARDASFLVRVGFASARATILRGEIEAVRDTAPAGSRPGAGPLIGETNDEIVFDRSSVEKRAMTPAAIERRLAWRQGMLAFDGETLREAAADVERQSGVHFEFADPAIGDMAIGGFIDGRDADAFVALLSSNLGLRAQRVSHTRVVLSRA